MQRLSAQDERNPPEKENYRGTDETGPPPGASSPRSPSATTASTLQVKQGDDGHQHTTGHAAATAHLALTLGAARRQLEEFARGARGTGIPRRGFHRC